MKTQNLIISHTVMLAAGFALGKYTDYEELKTYRDLHESTYSKWRRRLGGAAVGAVSLFALVTVVRVSTRSSKAA